MDKFSLKDSGRGDSEAGDSDYEPGRESPRDRLLGEGFSELYPPDGLHRPHTGTIAHIHIFKIDQEKFKDTGTTECLYF